MNANAANVPAIRRERRNVRCVTISGAKDNTLMGLGGQYGERGYAMAALLVALAVMSILMLAALPAWRFQAKREKELELVFRGEQYARAIGLYQLKNRSFPPSIEVLVQGRYLRKKYKDPMTKDGEFQPLFAGANPGPGGSEGAAGTNTQRPNSPPPQNPGVGAGSPGFQSGPGGLIGVVSKSKEDSIRLYKGRTKYNEWQFVFANANRGNPGGMGGQGQPGLPGGRGGRGSPGMGPGGSGPGSGTGSRPFGGSESGAAEVPAPAAVDLERQAPPPAVSYGLRGSDRSIGIDG
jgi:type II secretory pathway pseudopilin PulG